MDTPLVAMHKNARASLATNGLVSYLGKWRAPTGVLYYSTKPRGQSERKSGHLWKDTCAQDLE
eukprot:8137414-Pyramimonas_sp.AAC.1